MHRATAPPAGRLRPAEVVLAIASAALVGGAAAWIRPSELAAGLVLVAAVAAGAAPFVLFTFAGHPHRPEPATLGSRAGDPAPVAADASFTTVVRVGGEPLELVRACVILAARAGPTVVVASTRTDDLRELLDLGVAVYRAGTHEEALNAAVADIATGALLVIGPGAVPIGAACHEAAAGLRGSIGWAIGTVRPLAVDSYVPECREELGAWLRASARASGLVLWERDATIVRTDMLRRHPLEPDQPLGIWLRAQNSGGIEAGVVAMRFAPAGAAAFWPDTVGRQGALAADLGGVVRRGTARTRILALALLVREVYAYPLGIWLLAPLLVAATGTFPFRCTPGLFLVSVGGLAAARWLVIRRVLDLGLHPLNELVAAAFSARVTAGAARRGHQAGDAECGAAIAAVARMERARVRARVLLPIVVRDGVASPPKSRRPSPSWSSCSSGCSCSGWSRSGTGCAVSAGRHSRFPS